ncbi:MAG: electron transfer flavoprotein subunit alpha, partial [Anaerolineae bacterium]|nr:electron transfer flavoprotein subunit alpha [Anaerolineae bacterium]
MTDNRNVLVFVEQEEGKLVDVSLELLSKGRELADTLGSELWGLLCGHQIDALAETVIHHGADRVLLADHPELALYRTLPYARVAITLIKERQPYIVLVGATHIGRDLAP